MRSVLKQILLYLCLFLGVATLKAQHVEYGVALDTNYMMIGDQHHITEKLCAKCNSEITDDFLPGHPKSNQKEVDN